MSRRAEAQTLLNLPNRLYVYFYALLQKKKKTHYFHNWGWGTGGKTYSPHFPLITGVY